jgi:hypothetical protein
LATRRKKLWATTDRAELFDLVRELAGIRQRTELPEPTAQTVGTIQRSGCRIEKMILKPEEGIYLPALMFVPKQGTCRAATLYVRENGKSADATSGGPIEQLVEAGNLVFAVDLRGTGETQPTRQNIFTSYLLGRSHVGMRAEDILVCGRFLQKQRQEPVELVAIGHLCVPALHAAALEPDMFGSVKLVRPLISWSNIIETGQSRNQLVNTVHGALTVYDLPDLAATLAEKLTIEQPANALGEPIEKASD